MNENEKYNLPCPYDSGVMCVQIPCAENDENCCDDGCPQEEKAMDRLAEYFHETYERLAPDFSYETRKASAKPWTEVPENNKNLMIAVVRAVYSHLDIRSLQDRLTAANERIGELEEQLRWIPVSERLPEKGQFCHVFMPDCNNHCPFKGWYFPASKVWTTTLKSHSRTRKVTHWRPITLPEQEAQNDSE